MSTTVFGTRAGLGDGARPRLGATLPRCAAGPCPRSIGASKAPRRRARVLPGLLLALALGAAGCDEPTADLRSSVELFTAERGEVAERAYQRIARHGRTALPYLEAALHRVDPPGRRSVVTALRRLALPESAALLAHIAAFDADPTVRAAAYRTLESWAADSRPTAVALAARAALQQVDQARSPP
jgi:hypothetical protein